MSEAKDPAIKLFGKTIQLRDIPASETAISYSDGATLPFPSDLPVDDGLEKDCPSSLNSTSEENNSNRIGEEQEPDKDSSGEKPIDNKETDGAQPLTCEELSDPNSTSVTYENLKAPAIENDIATNKTSKTEEEQSEVSNLEEKTLKKPDKILPCPRCDSMDTKFCYYNNYNVSQPRHFCKNCQRYWTAGGIMRNVPVGAGRRKNKNSAFHYGQITVPEALQNARTDLLNGIHHPPPKCNGTVLNFGSDMPLCGDNGDDHSSGSSVTAASSKDEVCKIGLSDPMMQTCHNFPPQVACFPGALWPYQWNPTPWSSPVAAPAFCPAGFPMPFYPAPPYWTCTVPGTWNVPWITPPTSQSHASQILGKHSREEDNMLKSTNHGQEEQQKEINAEKCLWIPKTLRIDDPGEAARSSIWVSLGIKNDKANSIRGGGLFRAFRSKGDEDNHISESSAVLQANPAALSRSLKFQESS